MTNIEAYERFDESYCTRINQLFWIAGSSENSDLEDLLEELDESQIAELFPDFEEYEEYGITIQDIITAKRFGLLAEIHIPEPRNLKYDEQGNPVSWNTGAVSRVEYIYAETLEKLMIGIEKKSEQIFQECVKEDKSKK